VIIGGAGTWRRWGSRLGNLLLLVTALVAVSGVTGLLRTSGSAVPTALPLAGPPASSSVTLSPHQQSPDVAAAGEAVPERPGDTTVAVLNATGRRGLAAQVAAVCRRSGWRVVTVGNINTAERETTIYYGAPQQQAAAQRLLPMVPGAHRVLPSPASLSTAAAVTVVLAG
jgi:hypothetical protein